MPVAGFPDGLREGAGTLAAVDPDVIHAVSRNDAIRAVVQITWTSGGAGYVIFSFWPNSPAARSHRYEALPILHMPLLQTGQVPRVAGLPFFIETCSAF